MTIAIDSNVLLEMLTPGEASAQQSRQQLQSAAATERLVISEPVYAEVGVEFADRTAFDRFLADLTIEVLPSGEDALFAASQAWARYRMRQRAELFCPVCGTRQAVVCQNCGAAIRARQHVVADFIIGAHAVVHANRLLTRDRGYYGTYFPELELA